MSDRQEQQLTLWEYISPKFKLKQPVILLEMFAGIGAQHKALSILGVEIDKEKSKICEWAYKSYCGYNAIHIKDKTDYSLGKSKEELIERIKGTSTNYNDPLSLEQLNKKPIEWLRNAYNNCVATHNLVNVMEVKGSDLGELPSNQTSILTYSFPCQDLSLAGKRQGMATSQADGGTRSGLLWEIERILIERERERSTLPTILLMENVPEVVGSGNIQHFKKWEEQLRKFGYSNYVEILNGKNYGIPQNRRRCFMVSILGDYAYDFPCKIPLKYKLKDLLEKEVDGKYYLDEETIERISNWKAQQKPLDEAIDIERERERVSPTLTARGAGEEHSGMVLIKETFPNDKMNGGLLIKNATKQGYLEANIGDGIDISTRMETHRGTVQKGSCQTLTTQGGENVGVVVDESTTKRYKNYITWRNKKGEFNTECNRASLEDDLALTIPTKDQTKVALSGRGSKLRIRKLTPKECMRLMGFTDEDYQALKDIGLSDSAIYHCAGDSLIVPLLASMIYPMVYDIDNGHIDLVNQYVEKCVIKNGKITDIVI